MIVVLGRPALALPSPGVAPGPAGLVAQVAIAAAAEGRSVELVGTVGDDDRADELAVALGRAGVGHAALLRVAGVATPRPEDRADAWPRLDARDIDLGLRYVPEFSVLVLAEPLLPAVAAVAIEAAAYQAALVVALIRADETPGDALGRAATVLSAPASAVAPFAALVGRYAARLDAGEAAGAAFEAALREVGWEPSPEAGQAAP
ncbi:MAG: hypothetical protein ACXWPO_09605 [Candidatus Limnocylindrales bacterium]